jgi:tRNA dimethylallyltransferase
MITGPTAVGKSAVALHLARRLGGEIVSVDSMQVYRGLDIGTAKPATADRQSVPHHLVDVVDLMECFDAARFVQLASQAVTEIRARGKLPVFCGGTGLYFKAWLEGLGTAPPADPVLRAALETTPLPELLEELARHDPTTYATIDRKNPRRVIRALEVIRQTGRSFSEQRARWQSFPPGTTQPAQPGFWALCRLTTDLDERINRRVEEMFQQDLVEETRRLLQAGLERNPIALQSLGYRQVAEHLRGQRNLDDTICLVKQRTRQFARRQMTWFRRQAALEWMPVEVGESAASVAERILARWPGPGG